MHAYCPCGDDLVPGLSAADAAALDLPALVFRSGESDAFHTRETSEQVAAALPNARLVEPPWGDREWIERSADHQVNGNLFDALAPAGAAAGRVVTRGLRLTHRSGTDVTSVHAPHAVHRGPRPVPRERPHVRRARDRTAPPRVERGRASSRASCSPPPARPGSSAWPCPRSSAAAASTTSATARWSSEELQYAGVGAAGLGLTLHTDICLPYFLSLADRRAAGALAARHRVGRAHHRHRDDRARHRLRPRVDEHVGHPRRRPLRRERRQDVHHQRHQRRPRDHRGQDRPVAAARGHEPARARARDGRLRARPQPREGRPARAGHRRAVLHRRPRAGRQPARRRGQGLRAPRRQPAAGAALDRGAPASPRRKPRSAGRSTT